MTQTAKQFCFYFIYFSIFTSLNILWFKVFPDHNNISCHIVWSFYYLPTVQIWSNWISIKTTIWGILWRPIEIFQSIDAIHIGGRWIMISNRRFPISKIAFKSFPIVEVRILSVCRLNAKPLHGRTKHSVSFTNVLNVLKHSVSFP